MTLIIPLYIQPCSGRRWIHKRRDLGANDPTGVFHFWSYDHMIGSLLIFSISDQITRSEVYKYFWTVFSLFCPSLFWSLSLLDWIAPVLKIVLISLSLRHCEHRCRSNSHAITDIILFMMNDPPYLSRRLLHFQSWLDIVNTINSDSALYGIGLAPLQLDPLLPEPINIDQEMVGYQVRCHVGFFDRIALSCKLSKMSRYGGR